MIVRAGGTAGRRAAVLSSTSARLLLAAALGAVTLAAPREASAQNVAPPAATDDATSTAMARARFKEGVDFFDKGAFEQARASFLQAYALKKHPAVLLNLAWSCLKAGRFVEADRDFKQFLSEGTDISEKDRADANDGLTQTHAKIGRFDVMPPPGTTLAIDGEHVGDPLVDEGIAVQPGSHAVSLQWPDGTVDVQTVAVQAGERVPIRFSRKAGAASAETAPLPPRLGQPEAATSPPPAGPLPASAPPAKPRGHGIFPANMLPVYIGGLITFAGASVAVGMFAVKEAAQEHADQTTANVKAKGGSCPASPTSTITGLAAACDVISSDNDQVNADSTAGNVAFGIAIAGLVGTVTYWIVSDKQDASEIAKRTIVTPIINRTTGGLSIGGSF